MARTPFRIAQSIGLAVRKLTLWLSGDEKDIAASPTITWGTGAPSATANQGSVYIRSGGGASSTVYVNTDGAATWSALGSVTTAIGDDTALTFGANTDISIEYDEDGTDDLRITNGASDGDIVIEDDMLLMFGNDKNVWLEYDEDGNDTGIFGGTSGWRFPDSGILGFGTDGDLTITHDGTKSVTVGMADDAAASLAIKEGANNYMTFVTTNGGETITVGKSLDQTVSVTAADQAINADLSLNHATGEGRAVDAQAIQLTTARSSGIMAAVAGATTSLAGDSGGTYVDFYAVAPTDGGGSAVHSAIYIGAGHDRCLDLTAVATGEAVVALKDNLAVACAFKEATNSYLTFVTTNDAERVVAGKAVAFPAPTVVDMADTAHALVWGTAGAGETKLTSNIALVDPNSGDASEILTLPAVATSTGVMLIVINTGGEGIVVKDVAANTIITLDTAQSGIVVCDGSNWFGFMGGIT